MASFNTTVRQMTGNISATKLSLKKWPKCISEKNP